MSAALNGNLFTKINPVFRIALAAGGLMMMMVPGTIADTIGMSVIVAITVVQYLLRKRASTPTEGAAAA